MPLVFAPDADVGVPGLVVGGYGFRPTTNGFTNFQKHVEYGHTLMASGSNNWGPITGSLYGLYGHQYGNTGCVIAATDAKLYELNVNVTTFTTTDVSRATAYTPINPTRYGDDGDAGYWCFASMGNGIFASNKWNAAIQVQTTRGTAFTDVAGSPPCSTMTVFKGFLIAGDCGNYGAITGTNDMVAWCGNGDYTTWAPDSTTEANYARMLEVPGRIVAVRHLGDAVAVYKRNGIWLMRYVGTVGAPFTFNYVSATGMQGSYAVRSPIADIGHAHIYVGTNDIYMFDGVSPPRSITGGRVRDHLIKNYYLQSYGRLQVTRVRSDLLRQEVHFTTYGLVYNYALDKWGKLPYGVDDPAYSAMPIQSDATIIDVGASTMLNNVQTVSFYNGRFYAPGYPFGMADSGGYCPSMTLEMGDVGSNGIATTLTRIYPRFSYIDPTMTAGWGTSGYASAPQLACSTRTVLGVAAGTAQYAAWNTNQFCFDIVSSAYWHKQTLGIPQPVFDTSASTQYRSVEITGIEYSATAGGKRVEFPLHA